MAELPGKTDNDAKEQIETGMVWVWENSFNKEEKQMVERWVKRVHAATTILLGPYPFEIQYHIYERADSREPVPWAHTWRYPEQSVHFYIDTEYNYDSFIEDWTAPHEISHLSIPYIGERNSWFAEGYASFMQYQVMKEMGIMSEEEVIRKYLEKIKKVRSFYQSDDDLATVARNLKEGNRHAPMYWGGATYFLNLNKVLIEEHKTSLTQVVREYQTCCRLKDRSMNNVVESWDNIIGSSVATDLLHDYQTKPARKTIDRYLRK